MGFDFTQFQMIDLGIAFLILPIIAVAVRVWAKHLAGCGLTRDDYWILVALALSTACCITQLIAGIRGDLGQHQADYPNGSPILDDPRFVTYERCKFAMQLLLTVAVGTTKASVLLFFLQIFAVVRWFKATCYIMLAVVVGWTVSFFFALLFTCNPPTPFVESFYGHHCVDTLALWFSHAALDFSVDLIIVTLPTPLVIGLQMPLRRKLAVLCMFLMGGLVCAVSITRFAEFFVVKHALFQEDNYADETYYDSPVFFWSVIEASTGVIAACLPTYAPVFKRYGYFGQSASTSSSHTPIPRARCSKNMDSDAIRLTESIEMGNRVAVYKAQTPPSEASGIVVHEEVSVLSRPYILRE